MTASEASIPASEDSVSEAGADRRERIKAHIRAAKDKMEASVPEDRRERMKAHFRAAKAKATLKARKVLEAAKEVAGDRLEIVREKAVRTRKARRERLEAARAPGERAGSALSFARGPALSWGRKKKQAKPSEPPKMKMLHAAPSRTAQIHAPVQCGMTVAAREAWR